MSDIRFLPNLALLIGHWSIEMTTHSSTDSLHSTSITATKNWFADGRYVEESVIGEFADARHQKRTLLGFNPTRGRYEYVTADNHDTVLLLYTGSPQAPRDTQRINLWTDYVSPGDAAPQGVLLTVRTTFQITDGDLHTLSNYYSEPGQPERAFLEYKYRRRL
jgi:hypothetical protein